MGAKLIHSVDLKLARAKAQSQDLTESISAWNAKYSKVTVRCELREERRGFRLVVADFVEPAQTDDWGLLIGECIHNLRSSLDNLAYSLALLRHDPPPEPSRIAFPIFSDKSSFNRKARATLIQVPEPAAQLLEKIQPFNRDGSATGTVESDPLLLLQWLNNTDKHRIPSVVFLGLIDASYEGGIEFYSEEDAAANSPPDTTILGGSIEPGAVLLEWRTKNPIDKVKAKFNVRGAVAIETKSGPQEIMKILQPLSSYVALIVDQFRGFFAE